MGDPSENIASAFEFDEEEQMTESASEQLLAKFQPKTHDHSLDKYAFCQHYSDRNHTSMDTAMCIDIHEADDVAQADASGLTEEHMAFSLKRTHLNGILGMSECYNDHDHLTSVGMDISTDSDGEENNWNSQSEPTSSPCSDVPEEDEYMEGTPSDDSHPSDDFHNALIEMDDEEGQISIRPDYITCGTTLFVEPLLTFSSVGIKLETTDSDYDEGISMEWEISDIVYIKCEWIKCAEGVSMKILFQADHDSEKECNVKVSFSDIHWQVKEYKIRNLASRYGEIWNPVALIDTDGSGKDTDSALFFPKYYFSRIAQDFEDVIYPKGDPDAISISRRDVDLLLPETFVNDTIIDFYIKYLSSRISSNRKQKLHFFNSFFFRKLADLDKNPDKTAGGRAAFLRVRKWTRKFNIFDKDFIFIPVNFNLHWSLLVICHPGEIVELEDDVMESSKLPCVLHMDSLKGSHTGLKDIIQSYLWEEWKERHPDATEDNSSKFLNLRFVSLELPQQDNCFDCGLFLLHYVERFLDDAPTKLNPFMITDYSSFLTPEWFPPSEASFKRSFIRMLIYKLLDETSQKDGIAANMSNNGHSQNNDIELEAGVELLCPTETVVELSQPYCATEAVVSLVDSVNTLVCPVPATVTTVTATMTMTAAAAAAVATTTTKLVCQVIDTESQDDDHDKMEGENLEQNVSEGISHCEENTQTIEQETCILVDEEEEPSTILNEKEEPDENNCSGLRPDRVNLESSLDCNLATCSKLDANVFLEDSSKEDGIIKDPASPLPNPSEYVPDTPVTCPEDSNKKDDIMESPASPLPNHSGYVPDTPVISLEDSTKKDDITKNQASPLPVPFEYVPDTPVISLEDSTKKDDMSKSQASPLPIPSEYVPDTPVISLEDSTKKDDITKNQASPLPIPSEYVPDTPVISLEDSTKKDDITKKQASPLPNPSEYVPDTPVISLEDSSKKDNIMKHQASPLPNPSEYVPDTPVISFVEMIDKDGCEKAEKPMSEQIMDTHKTPVVSSNEVQESNQLQNENCEYVPDAQEVVPNTSCEEKHALSETEPSGKDSDVTAMEQVDMQIDETKKVVLNGEKGAVSTSVDPGTMDGESGTVASGDVVISDNDDEGSVDKDQLKDEMPRKKRRRVVVPSEVTRRVTRSSRRGSNHNQQ